MNKDNPLYPLLLRELLSSDYDSQPTKNEEYAEQLMKVHAQFAKRNGKLTDLLDDFIQQRRDRVKTNKTFKNIIFWFFVCLLGLLTIGVVVFIICNRTSESVAGMISLISVLATYLASLIAVFEIISKYLFPLDEEKDTISMIQTVINNDVKVEEIMSKEIDRGNGASIERLRALKQLMDDDVLTQEEFTELKKALLEKLKNC